MSDFYVTADNYVAAYLVTRKVPFRGSFQSGHTVNFRFDPVESIQDLLLDYAHGAEVAARDFVEAHRFILGLVKKTRNGGGA